MDENKKVENFIDVVGLIALRKSKFYEKVLETAKTKNITIDETAIKQKIADTNNDLFISTEEKRTKRLRTYTTLDALDLKEEDFMIKKL